MLNKLYVCIALCAVATTAPAATSTNHMVGYITVCTGKPKACDKIATTFKVVATTETELRKHLDFIADMDE